MKKINHKLHALADELEPVIDSMQQTFNLRTDRWKESEKGEEYQEKIDLLTEIKDQLSDWVEQLEADE